MLKKWRKRSKEEAKPIVPVKAKQFSTEFVADGRSYEDVWNEAMERTFQVKQVPVARSGTMDSVDNLSVKFPGQFNANVSVAALEWFGKQSFIGFQVCALLSQHWLIGNACQIPAEDAVRNGFKDTMNDGTEIDKSIAEELRQADVKYGLIDEMEEWVSKGKVFGIRVAYFKIKSRDPKYYEKPFNPDGIEPGSYEGIVQVDPYWMVGLPEGDSFVNPASIRFYEPTYWQIGTLKIHYSHVVIYREGDLPDILKPTYQWGGVPLTQKIYERVYAAERTANEAPLLALTKRTQIHKTDMACFIGKGQQAIDQVEQQVILQNNYGKTFIDKLDEDVTQFDTSLNDLDAVIMTQYQLVASIAKMPATKLLGTSPKGFNATGGFEFKNYHESLGCIQQKLTKFAHRHRICTIRSDIAPKFGIAPFDVTIVWNPLDPMTHEEEANVNKIKSDTDVNLVNAGAIDGQDVRNRIAADPCSGYNGIDPAAPELPEQNEEPDTSTGQEEMGEE